MNWIKALGLIPKKDKVPKGWYTARQIAKLTNKDITTVREALRVRPKETRKFRISTGIKVQMIPPYRLK